MLAGHDESGGELIEENGKKYRLFYGMSSKTAMDKHSGGVAEYRASEGKTVKSKIQSSETVKDITGGVRSTLYLCRCFSAKKSSLKGQLYIRFRTTQRKYLEMNNL